MGDWSYSLYLWHWPALIIVSEAWRPAVGWLGVLVIAAVVPLSAATYSLRREPVPEGAGLHGCAGCAGSCSTRRSSSLTLPMLAARQHGGRGRAQRRRPADHRLDFGQGSGDGEPEFSKDPVVALVQASVKAAENGYEIPADLKPSLLDLGTDIPDLGKCQYFEINNDRPLCPRGDTDGDKTLVLIGDSHARQWVPALDELAQRYGYTAYFLIREGCPVLRRHAVDGARRAEHRLRGVPGVGAPAGRGAAAGRRAARVGGQPARLHRPTTASSSTTKTTMATMYREGMEREIDYLSPNAGRVIVIGDPPAVMEHPGRCLSERDATLKSCLSTEDEVSLTFIDSLRQAAKNKAVEFVETAAWFCDDGLCPSVVGDYIAHRDRTHISETYADYLTDELEGADPPRPGVHRLRLALDRDRRLDHLRYAVSQPAHGPTLAHRDDVQGLRAIAVLIVIASHASVPFLPGGFVGVDVFFVISGFLISQLLFREVEKSGRLSIPGFYARRARRILPAATLVTVATVVGLGDLAERGRPARRSSRTRCGRCSSPRTSTSPPSAPTTSRRRSRPRRCSTTGRCRWRSSSTWSGRPLLLVLVLVGAGAAALPRRLVLVVLARADRCVVRVVAGQHGVGPAGGVLLDAGAGLGAGRWAR